jgi:hypothetical protein
MAISFVVVPSGVRVGRRVGGRLKVAGQVTRATGRVGGEGAFALPRQHGPDRRDPELGKLIDFETTLPSAVEELVRQREERQGG